MISSPGAQQSKPSYATWLLRLSWLVLLGLPLFLSIPHLNDYAWNYDEGPLLQTAALANEGYALYEEIVFNKPPLLIWWLQAAFGLGGTAVSTARLSILLLNLVGLAGLGWLAAKWWRWRWAGPLAIGLWLLLPKSLVRLAVVMNDLPGATLLLLALAAATKSRDQNQMLWTAVSGLLFGLTLGIHPLLLFAALPLALLSFGDKPFQQMGLKKAAAFGGGLLLAIAVWLLPSFGEGFLKWVITYNSAELDPGLQAWAAGNASRMALNLLHEYWLLLLLGVVSLLWLVRSDAKIFSLTAVLWFGLAIVTMLQLQPMWAHYVILAIYPIVLVATGGLAHVVHGIWQDVRSGQRRPYSRPLKFGAMIGLAALLLWQNAGQPVSWTKQEADLAAAQRYLRSQADSPNFFIGDDQFILFAAGKLTPPPLAETSSKRISTGFLTLPDILNGYFAYGVTHFVFTNGRFNQMPELQNWVETQAVAQTNFGEVTVFQLDPISKPETSVRSSLGSGIHLNGYTIKTGGSGLVINLHWEAAVPQAEEYHRFIHLLDENGQIVSQADGLPLAGWLPTQAWQPGVPIVETVALSLPAELPPGQYNLVTGLYTFPQIQRLPASNSQGERWANDAIPLQVINIP